MRFSFFKLHTRIIIQNPEDVNQSIGHEEQRNCNLVVYSAKRMLIKPITYKHLECRSNICLKKIHAYNRHSKKTHVLLPMGKVAPFHLTPDYQNLRQNNKYAPTSTNNLFVQENINEAQHMQTFRITIKQVFLEKINKFCFLFQANKIIPVHPFRATNIWDRTISMHLYHITD